MILRFSSGSATPGERPHEPLGRVDHVDLDPEMAREGRHHLLGLVEPQQPGVDENARQPVADSAMDERCRNRRIDPAGQAEDDFVLPDLRPDALDGLADVVGHVPVGAGAADLAHEAGQDRRALLRVRHFGMELDAVEAARLVGHAGDGAGFARRHQLEARRELDHLVAVAHPDVEETMAFAVYPVLDALEQLGVPARPDLGVAELTHLRALDLAAELLGHRLHPVADSEDRDAEIPDRLGRAWGLLLVHRRGPAGEDDPARRELADETVGDVVGVELAVDVLLAYPARD